MTHFRLAQMPPLPCVLPLSPPSGYFRSYVFFDTDWFAEVTFQVADRIPSICSIPPTMISFYLERRSLVREAFIRRPPKSRFLPPPPSNPLADEPFRAAFLGGIDHVDEYYPPPLSFPPGFSHDPAFALSPGKNCC